MTGRDSSGPHPVSDLARPVTFWRTTALLLLGLSAISAGEARGQPHSSHSLGKVEFVVSCSKEAQSEFNRAVALLHHMTYPGARQAFERVVAIDPNCAMAHWGVAMTLFQPLWPTRPSPADLQRGWEETQKAAALAPATDRERKFIEAAVEFFREPGSPDYWERIRRWEQGMQRAHATVPDDLEVAAFYALAHLAAAPANEGARAHFDRAATILVDLHRRSPEHPGTMHYIVHASDTPGRERELLEVVRKYESIAPRNPHALHMPTHIYTRLGEWDAVIRGNRASADAALGTAAGDRGQYVWDEFPHAIEYLVYGYLQKGADADAAKQVQRLNDTPRLQPTFKTAFHLASTRARYALERHAWTEAMSLVPRDPPTLDWDRFWWPEAVTWFARGLGAAHSNRLDEARHAAKRLQELETTTTNAGEQLFARSIRVLRLGVAAWLAHAARDSDTSVTLMRQAAELEASTPKHAVTPGPTLPAYELLGDLLFDQGKAADALEAYERSLTSYPQRFNSLIGAARAARATRNDAKASTFYRALLQTGGKSSRKADVQEAEKYLSGRG